MPEISEDLADYALRQLKKRKVEVLLNTKVRSATAGFVELVNWAEHGTEKKIPILLLPADLSRHERNGIQHC